MRVLKLGLAFSFCLLMQVASIVQAQDKYKDSIKKDSLLNKITDINKRIEGLIVTDSTLVGYNKHRNIDTLQTDSSFVKIVQRDTNGLVVLRNDWQPFDRDVLFEDTVIFEPVFLPVVFDGRVLPDNINFLSRNRSTDNIQSFYLISPDSTFAPQLQHAQDIKNTRSYYYLNNPDKVKLDAFNFSDAPVINQEVVEKKNPWQELLSTDNPIEITNTAPDVDKIQIKKLFWKKSGEHTLQLSQNQFSDNWGSDNNFNLFSDHKMNLNYKKKKVAFNNLIEWRLNLQQISGSKAASKINVIDDYFRSYSTFSIDAFKNWSYSSNLELKTPLFNKFKMNGENKVKNRAIFSPLEINLGLGMRYASEKISKEDKHRKFKVSADISALSLNYKFVGDKSIDETIFGIEKDKSSKIEYGSSLNLNLTYNRNRYTNFTSRIKYFTNYEKVYVECENALNFALNRYLSTTVYLYIKYDDSVPYDKKDNTWGYFMYNEMLRFGLNYKW